MRVLVTGVAGTVGRRVADELAGRGHEVVAMLRRSERLSETGFELVEGDLSCPRTTSVAMTVSAMPSDRPSTPRVSGLVALTHGQLLLRPAAAAIRANGEGAEMAWMCQGYEP